MESIPWDCSQRSINQQEQKIDMVKFTFVEAKNAELPKPPIGFFISLWKGVEAVNSFPILVLIPILLDCFLWFGPRFSMAPWFLAHKEYLQNNNLTSTTAAGVVEMNQFFQQFNLASSLSAWGLFPPSLMASTGPIINPIGNPVIIPLTSTVHVLEVLFAFFLLSLPLGAVYWAMVGLAVAPESRTWRGFLGSWGRLLAFLLFSAIVLTVAVLFIGLPVFFVASLLTLISAAISPLILGVYLIASWAILWILLFLAFSPHDAVLFPSKPLQALLRSIECVRVQYPSAMIPLMLWGGLLWMTHFVWALPPTNDWLGLVGIAGSAYTSSMIVASSLLYYKDRRRWLDETKAFLMARQADQTAVLPSTRG
jgi:hypothetical protein